MGGKKEEGNINPETTLRFFFFLFLLHSSYENILRAFGQEGLSFPAHFHIVLTRRRPAALLYRRWPTEFIRAAVDSAARAKHTPQRLRLCVRACCCCCCWLADWRDLRRLSSYLRRIPPPAGYESRLAAQEKTSVPS